MQEDLENRAVRVWEGGGVTVERGNLPSSEQCGRSRSIAGGNTYTIAPPLRREWPLTSQGLPAPQHNRPPMSGKLPRSPGKIKNTLFFAAGTTSCDAANTPCEGGCCCPDLCIYDEAVICCIANLSI